MKPIKMKKPKLKSINFNAVSMNSKYNNEC